MSASTPGPSSAPLCGGPPASARSQKLPHISSQATCPSGAYFSPAERIGLGSSVSYESWYCSGSSVLMRASSASRSTVPILAPEEICQENEGVIAPHG